MRTVVFALAACLPLFSCGMAHDTADSGRTVDCAAAIAAQAFAFAVQYRDAETEYAWGGQDALRTALRLDCSGLVVRCYGYAADDERIKAFGIMQVRTL